MVWRIYLLRAYALAVGLGLFVFGLAGFTPSPLSSTAPENALHLGVGLIFFCGGLLVGERDPLRSFLGGMGLLLLVGKGTIVVTRWVDEGFFHLPQVGIVCLVAGVTSLLLAAFAGIGTPSKD